MHFDGEFFLQIIYKHRPKTILNKSKILYTNLVILNLWYLLGKYKIHTKISRGKILFFLRHNNRSRSTEWSLAIFLLFMSLVVRALHHLFLICWNWKCKKVYWNRDHNLISYQICSKQFKCHTKTNVSIKTTFLIFQVLISWLTPATAQLVFCKIDLVKLERHIDIAMFVICLSLFLFLSFLREKDKTKKNWSHVLEHLHLII